MYSYYYQKLLVELMNLSISITRQFIKYKKIGFGMAAKPIRLGFPVRNSNHYGKPQYRKRGALEADNIDGEETIDCGLDGEQAIQHTVAKVGLQTLKSIMHALKTELCAWVLHVGILMYGRINDVKEYHLIGGPQLGLWALISNKERPEDGKVYIPVELSMPIDDYVNDPQNQFHGFYLFGAEDTFGPKCFGE